MEIIEHFDRCLRAPEPRYKVFRVYKNSGRKKILYKNLMLETAKKIVNSFPDSEKSMVCFTKQ
jgi:hypothetical protein